MLWVIIFLVIVVPFLYVLVKDYRVIKNELKNNPVSILKELLFILSLFVFFAGLISKYYMLSNVAAIFLLLLSLKRLLNLWKTNKIRVIYTLVLFILFFSLPYLLN
ncbi:hypothetical protein DZB84_18610 [Bacillus sp. HNG]|nr:hypothetical protein DZB84_18610 [Bacillus sp. HNG]